MRIVVNDIAASYGGALSILKQFYDYIYKNDTENEWFFLLSDKYVEETENIRIICLPEIKRSRIKKIFFDCVFGKNIINKYKPDVVVSLQNIITFGVSAPQVVYVHQSIPFQKIKKFSFFKANERSSAMVQHLIGAFIKQSIKRADKVFVQTQWMKESVVESVCVPSEKVFIAFPSVGGFIPDTKSYIPNRFFYPTTSAIYKNNNAIVEACDMLVSDGITDFEVRLTLPEGYIKHGNIKCVGRLTAEEIQKEYQLGTLIYPSYIETVGLPLLEARSCHSMILASDTPFSHECMQGYENVFYFSPFDSNELMKIMKRIITCEKTPQEVHEYRLDKPSWKEFYEGILSCKKYSS